MRSVDYMMRGHLLSKPAVATMVNSRIYEGRLPDSLAATVGVKAIVIREAGGAASLHSPVVTSQVSFDCVGANEGEAKAVYEAVHDALDGEANVAIAPSPNRIVSAVFRGRPARRTDPDTGWATMTGVCEVVLTMQ